MPIELDVKEVLLLNSPFHVEHEVSPLLPAVAVRVPQPLAAVEQVPFTLDPALDRGLDEDNCLQGCKNPLLRGRRRKDRFICVEYSEIIGVVHGGEHFTSLRLRRSWGLDVDLLWFFLLYGRSDGLGWRHHFFFNRFWLLLLYELNLFLRLVNDSKSIYDSLHTENVHPKWRPLEFDLVKGGFGELEQFVDVEFVQVSQLVVLTEVRKLLGSVVGDAESQGLATHVFGPMCDIHRKYLHGAVHFVVSLLPGKHRRACWVFSHGVIVFTLPLFHDIHFAAPRDDGGCLILGVTS